MSSSVCVVCGSTEFGDPQDGLFFCLECGTQSQDVREEVSQVDRGGGRFTRTLRSKKKKYNKKTESEESGHPMAIFQQVLRRQCEAMISLGFNPSIKDAARLIWFTYLRHYGYAFRSPSQSISGRSPRKRSGHTDSSEYPSSSSSTTTCTSRISGSLTARNLLEKFEMADGKREKKKGTKRPRSEEKSQTSVRKATKKAKVTPEGVSEYDNFPDDKYLFEPSQQETTSSEVVVVGNRESSQTSGKDLTEILPGSSSSQVRDTSKSTIRTIESISSWNELEEVERGMNCRQLLAFRHSYLVSTRVKPKFVADDEPWADQPRLFKMRMTVSILYLALLYTQQTMLPADLIRWVRREKVPLNTPFQAADGAEKQNQSSVFFTTSYTITTTFLLDNAFRLYLHLPLPPIPRPDPHAICHIILDKLKLTECFKKLVDRALDSVYQPVGFSRQLRMDSECAAVIIIVFKILYGLDDHTELEESPHMVGVSGPGKESDGEAEEEEEELTSANSLLVWVDWVQLYCTQISSEEDIPVNHIDLNKTKNHNYYLQFCRETVFTKCRPNPTGSKSIRTFEPVFNKKISNIFSSVTKTKEAAATTVNTLSSPLHSQTLSPSLPGSGSGTSTTECFPRLVHISRFVEDPKAPCTTYRHLPSSHQSTEELDKNHLSHAMRFLISVLCQVVDTTPGNLFTLLLSVERVFTRGTLLTVKNLTEVLTTNTSQ